MELKYDAKIEEQDFARCQLGLFKVRKQVRELDRWPSSPDREGWPWSARRRRLLRQVSDETKCEIFSQRIEEDLWIEAAEAAVVATDKVIETAQIEINETYRELEKIQTAVAIEIAQEYAGIDFSEL